MYFFERKRTQVRADRKSTGDAARVKKADFTTDPKSTGKGRCFS